MKYWTLFTVRMLARVGLSATLIVWLQSHREPIYKAVRLGSVDMSVSTHQYSLKGKAMVLPHGFTAYWRDIGEFEWQGFKFGYIPPPEPEYPGSFRASRNGYIIVVIDHWFLCLSFLIAVIATWPRKKRTPPTESGE